MLEHLDYNFDEVDLVVQPHILQHLPTCKYTWDARPKTLCQGNQLATLWDHYKLHSPIKNLPIMTTFKVITGMLRNHVLNQSKDDFLLAHCTVLGETHGVAHIVLPKDAKLVALSMQIGRSIPLVRI